MTAQHALTTRSEQRCFDGTIGFYSHAATTTGSEMRFAVYVPPHVEGWLRTVEAQGQPD